MPTVSFNATFSNYREVELHLTDQEWADLQSGKKKYWDFLDAGDYDSGEWADGFVVNTDTMETL
jgi:hypothetical protein